MRPNQFSFLNKKFRYQDVAICNDEILKKCKTVWGEDADNYKYATGIVEVDTNELILIGLTTELKNYESFEFYLNQLTICNVQNVVLLLALVSLDAPLNENAFQFPTMYPSSFAADILKETYGNVVFRHQIMQLLGRCLPPEENNSRQIIEYTRQFNCKQKSFFDMLEKLYLPDGYSLYKLLEKYTPHGRRIAGDFGFVSQPLYQQAYQFIQSSNKYISK